ncbi:MAG: SpoIIE family protein phosphatase [Candidatus Riflebacteria bacterium]|nr:SpoIIE family protein phosphatase [Candidatus Riflebacteria bacterium]
MRTAFLNTLAEVEDFPCFSELSSNSFNLLKDFTEYRGMALRLYTGNSGQPWKEFRLHKSADYSIDELYEMTTNPLPDNPEELLVKKLDGTRYITLVSPYMVDSSHFADLILLISADTLISTYDWHFFADHLAVRLCSKFFFPLHLTRNQVESSDRLLSFLRETQKLLNTSRHADALPPAPGYEQKQAQLWFDEDNPMLTSFLLKLQRAFNFHTVFVLQHAGPDTYNQVTVMAAREGDSINSEIEEMVEIAMQHYKVERHAIISKSVVTSGNQEFSSNNLTPLVFSCQAGGQTYGHLGFLLSDDNFKRHISHRSKLMPTLANQLGLYFSHYYQLRKEARHGRMLQQINQTCNTIISSVNIDAILFKLVESLNYLFGQYSGAILMFSRDTSELGLSNFLGGEKPENLDINKLVNSKGPVVDAINEGSAFDNRNGHYQLPIRYVLPLATTPQASAINTDFLPLRSLGGVVLFESELNKPLAEEDLAKLMPILLNGMSAALQVASNYAEKLDTIKALEGMMERLSDTDALLDEMVVIIRRLLKVNRISFLEVDESGKYLHIKKGYGLPPGIIETTKIPIGEEISGYVAQQGRSYRIDNIESEGVFKKRSVEHYLNRSLLSVPLVKQRGGESKRVIGVINVNNKTNGLTFTLQDQQLLEAIAHLVVTALENVRFMEEEHEKELLERQLNDARDIQMSLMPKSFTDLPISIDMFGKSTPARQIGGDFFDILNLDDGRLLAVLGDVSGKGMPAAILMAVTRIIIRSVVQDCSDPLTILDRVNKKLSNELDSYHFVTLQLVAIDPLSGQSEMSSAGHGPLMVKLSGNIQLIETRSGPPLGITDVSGIYHKDPFKMSAGDVLIMYTDGLSEEHAPDGEMFGTDRINELLDQHSEKTAKELAEALIAAAVKWRGASEAHDDLTVLTLKYKG